MTIGIVGAKGRSHRLPGKNLRAFHGTPLFMWSVIQLLNSRRVDKVYVTTDDEEVAGIAREAKALAHMRHTEEALAPDASMHGPVFELLTDLLETNAASRSDRFIMALPTSPLRSPWDFDHILERLEGADFVLPLCQLHETIIYDLSAADVTAPVIADKNFNFAIQGGGSTGWRLGHYLDELETYKGVAGGLTDSELDDRFMVGLHPPPALAMPRGGLRRRFYLEPWQQWEIDDETGWNLCEIVMQHRILGPLGSDCYEAYAGGKEWEHRTVIS